MGEGMLLGPEPPVVGPAPAAACSGEGEPSQATAKRPVRAMPQSALELTGIITLKSARDTRLLCRQSAALRD
jgi:hypothetical protein